ncbi:MAG: hypothetical protein IJL67_00065, partial [Oscillospiraceae bacterium]|nr:hypothetical protein [Oscillospiraceae bacterium]
TVLLMDLPVRVIALIILFISIRYGVLIFAFSEILITLIGVLFASVMGKRVLDYSFGEICSDYLVNTLLAGIMGLLTWLIGAGLHFGSVAEMLIQIICGIVIYVGLSFVTKNQSFNFAVNLAKDFLQKRKCEEEHE